MLSEKASPAELSQRYNIASGKLYNRVEELERLLGNVTLENELLKKALHNCLKKSQEKESSLPKTTPSSKALKGVRIDETFQTNVPIINPRKNLQKTL